MNIMKLEDIMEEQEEDDLVSLRDITEKSAESDKVEIEQVLTSHPALNSTFSKKKKKMQVTNSFAIIA